MNRRSRRPIALAIAPLLFIVPALVLPLAPGSVRAQDEAAADPVPGNGVTAIDIFDYPPGPLVDGSGGHGWKGDWLASRNAVPVVELASVTDTRIISGATASRYLVLRGTGDRNNPVRRQLAEPLSHPEVYLRFQLQYRGGTSTPANDPEFFVLWLDRLDGGDGATHANNTPNIGLHVADRGPDKGKTVFMIRIGPANTAWSRIEVRPDHTYTVITRLRKSGDGPRAEYDQLDLWIDPAEDALSTPAATVSGAQSLSQIGWLGFGTGLKTEPDDRILISELMICRDWKSAIAESASIVAAAHRDERGQPVWQEHVDFRRDVYPLLKQRCFDCHSGEHPDSGFRLDVYAELRGYSTGEILAEPGRGHASRLIAAISATETDRRMPPEGEVPLNESEIAMLRAWIDQGMAWDDELLPAPRVTSDHWAFQPVVRPEVPDVVDPAWVATPVDAFISQAHVDAGIEHSAKAAPRTLVRRLYLDLIGLPPTPEEVDEFLRDPSDAAVAALVERLLASAHYGERWGRYWLDLARWAESQGYQHDFVRPWAWRYRDYVIRSFNADKPYDQFLKEQLAGDELLPYSDDNLIATGFLGSARISGNEEDDAIQRNDVLVDMVNATGSAILGLTIECAQCHNHKFDPISQRDYYRLQAFFAKGQLGNLSLRDPGTDNPSDLDRWIPGPALDYYQKEVAALTRKKLYTPTTDAQTWGYLSAATGDAGIRRFSVVNRHPMKWSPATLRATEARMLIRGEARMPGPVVEPGWPEVLGPTPQPLDMRSRSALADWMTSPENPLVARIWVNRLWQYHFGRGIVATSSDFGVEGASPTHPELLDWLASELMASGWSTKHIHRLIVMSNTWQQQRRFDAANSAIDPDNQLLWCWPRRRLEAEAIRDAVLVATGELNRQLGGVSIPPERDESELRRTIYLFQQRSSMPSVMAMFDAPEGIASCSRRAVSTVALQPLYLLNSEFMANRAASLAETVRQYAGSDPDEQITLAFERTLTRPPDAEERNLARTILASTEGGFQNDNADVRDSRNLVQLCHALLNLNEFVYIP